jgi:hypothetical protein
MVNWFFPRVDSRLIFVLTETFAEGTEDVLRLDCTAAVLGIRAGLARRKNSSIACARYFREKK